MKGSNNLYDNVCAYRVAQKKLFVKSQPPLVLFCAYVCIIYITQKNFVWECPKALSSSYNIGCCRQDWQEPVFGLKPG